MTTANQPPLIGITCDTAPPRQTTDGSLDQRRRYESPDTYAHAVEQAGGVPILIPHEPTLIDAYIDRCDGFILSGGDDPDMTHFNEPMHPLAKGVDAQRQQFELALLTALDATEHPVLGICLGMQWMALHANGQLLQHLPDVDHLDHVVTENHRAGQHAVQIIADQSYLSTTINVQSHHHQAIADSGTLRIIGHCPHGVIEAIDAPNTTRFYLGVQWHPELTTDPAAGAHLFQKLVQAAQP